jgi:uncharacterized protein YndB with AHSA1/START domain
MNAMTDADQIHVASRLVRAEPEAIFQAFMTAETIVRWLPPKGASAEIGVFEPHVGGLLRMTLSFEGPHGKSSENTDVFDARFIRIEPPTHIRLSVDFVSDDPRFAGTMTMDWRFEPVSEGSTVTVVADQVPVGIERADHETALASTLSNLADLVEKGG